MSRFECTPTPLPGLMLVQRQRIQDARGYFSRLFCADELAAAGFTQPIAQINQTLTRQRGSVRGMHYQTGDSAEDKFVSCLRGEIWDVAVDLRPASPSFLSWHAEKLSADNGRSLFIPKGFAHGFQTLTDDCELLYLHTQPYNPRAEAALNPLDPRLAITWPLPVTEMSQRDRDHPMMGADFKGLLA